LVTAAALIAANRACGDVREEGALGNPGGKRCSPRVVPRDSGSRTASEPFSIRPAAVWLDERRRIARILSSLQGPLLIGADQQPAGPDGTANRLERLADILGVAVTPAADATAMVAAPGGPGPIPRPAASSAVSAALDAPLTRLEQLVANLSEHAAQGMTNDAPA
jgi:hypothetical protein